MEKPKKGNAEQANPSKENLSQNPEHNARGKNHARGSRDERSQSLTRMVQTAMVMNELERLRVIQGEDTPLTEDWITNYEDVSVVHFAAFCGDLNSLKRLLRGKDKTLTDVPTEGGPKLLKQEMSFDADPFKKFLFYGFFLNSTPLMMAAQQGHLSVVKYLIDHACADVNSRDSLGLTPLALAAASGHVDVAKYLIGKRAQKNVQDKRNGMTPLILAVVNNQTEMAIALVRRNVNVHVKDSKGRMAVHYAAWNYNFDLVQYLASQRNIESAINAQDMDGNTPLHLLVSDIEIEPNTLGDFRGKHEQRVLSDILQKLKATGDDLSVDIKRTIVRGSKRLGEECACLAAMLKLGAKPNIKNKAGRTVLHVLCSRLTSVLSSHGYLLIDDPALNQTLLVMMSILLKLGASTVASDYEGNTPIVLALQRRNWAAVKMLSRDADTEPRSDITVEPFKNMREMVDAYGWEKLTKCSEFEDDVDLMSSAILSRHKKTTVDMQVDRIMCQAISK